MAPTSWGVCGGLEHVCGIWGTILALSTFVQFALTMLISAYENKILADNGLFPLLLCSCARQFKQFGACRGYGMGPIVRSFSSCDTARNLIEEVRRRNRAIERRDKMSGERIQGL